MPTGVYKTASFVGAPLVFALLLAGCAATVLLKKPVLSIALHGIDLGLAALVGIYLMQALNGVRQEGPLLVLAVSVLIYSFLAAAALILTALNRKTL